MITKPILNLTDLKSNISGEVISPDDASYHEFRKLYNGMIDKKPALIVKCKDQKDIVTALYFAKDNSLEIAIRSGGHNGAGLDSCDNGLSIDLSLMKNIHVDPVKKTAKVETGCTLGDIDLKTQAQGSALPSGVKHIIMLPILMPQEEPT